MGVNRDELRAEIERRWQERQSLRVVYERLSEPVEPASELGQELAAAGGLERARLMVEERLREIAMDGDLSYALAIVDPVCGIVEGSELAMSLLGEITGRNWLVEFSRRAAQSGVQLANPRAELLSVLWEHLAELAGAQQRGQARVYRDQRAALAQTIENALSDHLGGKRKPRPEAPGKKEALTDPAEPEHSTFSLEDRLTLAELLRQTRLSDLEQRALSLRLQGLVGQGLADALGVKPKTAQELQRRALKKLREAL